MRTRETTIEVGRNCEGGIMARQPVTRIHVRYNIGFPNDLYLRGEGAGLSWTKGKKMENVSSDEWVWESHSSFEECEFKVLVNDSAYEGGYNHHLGCGHEIHYTPHFG
jgi:hypothetical protein